ncbi:MAG: T9SS type A sorting domain-containing protein, partial [Eudoraea sp.]|nr:T9SS type A sorting domain-containing protein [Eudoraea sp.]
FEASDPSSQSCYTLTIDEMIPLDVSSKMNDHGTADKYSLNLNVDSGTPPFTVTLNRKFIGTFQNKEISLDVSDGDEVVITSNLACEGSFKMTVPVGTNLMVYPNPTASVIHILLNEIQSGPIPVLVYDATGRLITSGKVAAHNNILELPIQQHPSGVYFIKVPSLNNKTIKVIKQ